MEVAVARVRAAAAQRAIRAISGAIGQEAMHVLLRVA
jgi:hypothetical protein